MINPQSQHGFHLLLRISTFLAVLGVLVWAALPSDIDAAMLEAPEIGGPADVEILPEPEEQAVPEGVFGVNLWHMPSVETPKRIAPTTTRVVFELLAISSGQDETGQQINYSVIYDPAGDQVHTLSIGQSINGYTVSEILSDSVLLQNGKRETTLVLESGEDG